MDRFLRFDPIEGALRVRAANDLVEEILGRIDWQDLSPRERDFCKSLLVRVFDGKGATRKQLRWLRNIFASHCHLEPSEVHKLAERIDMVIEISLHEENDETRR